MIVLEQRRAPQVELNDQQLRSIRSAQGNRARTTHTAPRGQGARHSAARKTAGKKQAAARRRSRSANRRALMWLWCFPAGLLLMWKRGCTWPTAVKIGISVAMAAIVAALVLIPMPGSTHTAGGVQLVAAEPQVDIYGPELPAYVVPGYTNDQSASIIVDADTVDDDVEYVYAAAGASCYHRYDCKFAYASSMRLTVYEAVHLKYTPCGLCNPPAYNP